MANDPDIMPAWARELAEIYRGGSATLFIVHGSVHDFVPAKNGDSVAFHRLKDYLAKTLFPSRESVVFFDPSSGITFADERSREDFHRVAKASANIAGKSYDYSLPRHPPAAARMLDTWLKSKIHLGDGGAGGVALIIDYAQMMCPPGEYAQMSGDEMSALVTVLKWANDPALGRSDATICLIVENLADLHPAIVMNPFAQKIRVDLPDKNERADYIRSLDEKKILPGSEFDVDSLADRTGGLSRINILQILSRAAKSGDVPTSGYLAERKKELIEKECHGLIEFLQPRHGLDMVGGHEAAKRWLKDDARLLRESKLDALPMGYLICGPVGTGKSFMVSCAAGEIGIPLLRLKNFRSQWVGATEANLERIFSTLRSIGPVGVVIDEADAALGSRRQSGDSGVSSRVFGMVAEQMGDTSYRGRILWFLLTARPDLLPIDLKRQGRAETHIPLFHPESPSEIAAMAILMAKKNNAPIDDPSKLKIHPGKSLSGSDVEAVVVRANRERILKGAVKLEARRLSDALNSYIARASEAEIRLQTLVAISECSNDEFLPERYRSIDPEILSNEIAELKRKLRDGD